MSITKLMDEQDQIKVALRNELAEENPNEDTVLACRLRIRSLDSTIAYYLRKGV
jgi:hypothetical protein